MESIETLIDNLSHEHYLNLKQAIETGRWHTGEKLTLIQRQSAIQALLLYEVKYCDNQEHLTVNKEGHINMLSKDELKKQFQQDN